MTPPPPDPSHGLFETLLISGGRPVELVAHLGRLAGSARELFGAELPDELPGDAVRACAGIDLGRVRVDIAPNEEGVLSHSVAASAIEPGAFFPEWERGERLRSVGAEGWSGAHKWSDRRWLESTEQELEDEVPLLVDAEGNALEAGRANLFIVADGALATPPVDGRILPGTARAATLEIAADLGIEATERAVSVAELREDDEVFLTSSVKGLRPVRWLDGVELERHSTLVERLAAELRERWLGSRAREP